MENNYQLSKIRLAKWLFIVYAVVNYLLPNVVPFIFAFIGYYNPLLISYVCIPLAGLLFLGATWTLKAILEESEKNVFIYWTIAGVLILYPLLSSFIFSAESNHITAGLFLYGIKIVLFLLFFLGLDILRRHRNTDGFNSLMQAAILLILINVIACINILKIEEINDYLIGNGVYILSMYSFLLLPIICALSIYLIVGFVKMSKALMYDSSDPYVSPSANPFSQRMVGLIGAVVVCACFTYLIFSNINLINF